MKILIIGGVAAGTKAAAKLKRENRDYNITILTKSSDISYAGCGLPYYVGGLINDPSKLIVNSPESFSALTGVKVLTEMEVTKVNQSDSTVEGLNLKTKEAFVYAYDKLVIASGASPFKPAIEGTDLKGVYFMRTPDDAVALRAAVDAGEIKRAIVVGGGFIGLEVAENLSIKGVKVSILDMADHILPGFDPELCEYVENHLADQGIMTFTNTMVEGILGQDKVEKVQTQKRAMKCDAVILAMGIRANTSFLAGTTVELMQNKTIKVNEYLQTSDENIYAIGDCACVTNSITQAPAWSPMGSSANIEGRIVAKNIAGEKIKYMGVLGTGVCKLPNLNVGRTGLTEQQGRDAGFEVVSVVTVVNDKAHYYPSASTFIVKLIADRKNMKLLGLQVIGTGSVDKMVDIAVTAITMKASLTEIQNMDLAYAPPFSTAIHPFSTSVNILLNKISGEFSTMTPYEYKTTKGEGYKVIDTSQSPTITGASYIDLTKVAGPVEGYDLNEKLLLVCNKGRRAYLLQNRLKHYGYTNTLVLEGGTTFSEIEL